MQLFPMQEVHLEGQMTGQNPFESGVMLELLVQVVQLLGMLKQAEHAVALQIGQQMLFGPLGTSWYCETHEVQLLPVHVEQY